MRITFPEDRIRTLYGCTPKFGAGMTLKLLVKSASESCKLQLVSSISNNILKQDILVFVFQVDAKIKPSMITAPEIGPQTEEAGLGVWEWLAIGISILLFILIVGIM